MAIVLQFKNKKMKNTRLITVSILLVLGCYSFNMANNENQDIKAFWMYVDHKKGITSYVKVDSFAVNKGGIAFKEEGKLIKRGIAGWCATPPITYSNSEGTWKQTSDSTLTIRYNYWNGKMNEDWHIVKLSLDSLKVIVSNSARVMEKQK